MRSLLSPNAQSESSSFLFCVLQKVVFPCSKGIFLLQLYLYFVCVLQTEDDLGLLYVPL